MKLLKITTLLMASLFSQAQNVMTPEILWSMKRLSVKAVEPSFSKVFYALNQTDIATENQKVENFLLDVSNLSSVNVDKNLGRKKMIQWDKNGLYAIENQKIFLSKDNGKNWQEFYHIGEGVNEVWISPDGKKIAFSKEVLEERVRGFHRYDDLPKTNAYVYQDLNHRHWDYFNEGKYNHIFIVEKNQKVEQAKDILKGKLWDSPQRPFGGREDGVWSPDSENFLYVTKPLSGIEYAKSTNTDIFSYEVKTGKIKNLTQENQGYDTDPKFSPDGKTLFWLSMKRDGYEADKHDIKMMSWKEGKVQNLTQNWDESVTGSYFVDNKNIYFSAAYRGVKSLFSLEIKNKKIIPIATGQYDVGDILALNQGNLLITRTDINHAAELFLVNLKNGKMKPATEANKEIYDKISPSTSELKMVKTTDGKEMGVWFHYPPNFDANKKYPVLLYCQGGPQSALTQYFSLRWNFALMTAQGYIVVAPNRRGMPGWGVEWNEKISKDWGGQPIRDYLSAADFAKTLPYVDGQRMAAVGASYGGYSVLMLAGVHQKRFKTFISHNGLFDMKSWYLNTEELFFANWDLGGSPYDEPLAKAYTEFNPSQYVKNWDTPIMIIQGGKDYRVPYEQGQGAFQAARLKGLKSKFLYYPNENHWVLNPQNSILWQREFFSWLKETL